MRNRVSLSLFQDMEGVVPCTHLNRQAGVPQQCTGVFTVDKVL